jgi:integration host factor subunit alpha
MSLGKRDIIFNLSSKTQLTNLSSSFFLNTFINLIKSHSKTTTVKISNFGTFQSYVTPTRLGRNPRTGENYTISKRTKLSVKVSQNIKNILNK